MRWSRTLLWLALVALSQGALAVPNASRPQDPKDDPEAAIRRLLAAQQSDWNHGDIRGFMQGYWNSPELTFAGSKEFTRGWEPVLERYQKTYADRTAMGKLDFSELEVRPLGPEAAVVLGKWHVQREAGDVGGIFTLVLRKFSEGWRIIHDHTTQSPPETK